MDVTRILLWLPDTEKFFFRIKLIGSSCYHTMFSFEWIHICLFPLDVKMVCGVGWNIVFGMLYLIFFEFFSLLCVPYNSLYYMKPWNFMHLV